MTTIPANQVVNSLPGVLAAGGSALDLNGMFLTNNISVPIGSVLQMANAAAVQSYFGPTSIEASFAAVYFAGYDNSSVKPGNMLFTQYNTVPVNAYIRGGNIAAALTLTQLQSINGALSITIDSSVKSGTPNLSGATSFSNAAQIINTALGISGVVVGTFTGSIATTTLTVASTPTAPLAAGQIITGSTTSAGTYIVSQLTGTTGGIGTYQVTNSQTVTSATLTASKAAVSFDSISGGFIVRSGTTGSASSITYATGAISDSLFLTQATGAVLSQGAAAQTPAAFMTTLANTISNWATFNLTFNPDTTGQNSVRLAFAAWTSLQSERYIYAATDSDLAPTTSTSASSSLGALVKANNYAGVSVNWQPSETYLGGLVAGIVASFDYDQLGGRTTANGRTQSGFTPGVTDLTTYTNLKSNGYNFYAAFATANQQFNWYSNGSVSGPFTWLDSLANSIWLTNQFQLDLMILLQNTGSIPYNSAGKAMIEEGLSDTIAQGLAYGVYRVGVSLSGTQKAAVTALAGQDISGTLSTQGWYLLVGDATPAVRQARGSPPCTFFYMDGESVQQINIQSINLL